MTTISGFRAALLWGCLAGISVDSSPAADVWPQFRGPSGQGHADAKNLPATWSENENVVWRVPLPGKGWSSPVADEKFLWLTAAVEQPLDEELKAARLKDNTGGQPVTLAGHVDLFALGVDRRTGELSHEVQVLGVDDPQWIHTLNSYASPTPVLQAGKLYCHFGALGNVCLDTATRKIVWTNDSLRIMHENGPGSSPILWQEKMIFHCDGSDEQYIAALDAKTGRVAWKTPRSGEMNASPQLKKAYGTPLIVPTTIDDRRQDVLLSPAANWLYAYDPATGRELWKLSYGTLGFSIVPRPVAGHGMVYLCTTYNKSELLAIRLPVGANDAPTIAWRYKKSVPNMPSPLLIGEEIYLFHDNGVATCLNALTGAEHWSQRLGGKFCSSPLYADGKIFIGNREGETLVLKPGTTFEKPLVNKLDGEIMAAPIALDGAIYLRTDRALYKIAKP